MHALQKENERDEVEVELKVESLTYTSFSTCAIPLLLVSRSLSTTNRLPMLSSLRAPSSLAVRCVSAREKVEGLQPCTGRRGRSNDYLSVVESFPPSRRLLLLRLVLPVSLLPLSRRLALVDPLSAAKKRRRLLLGVPKNQRIALYEASRKLFFFFSEGWRRRDIRFRSLFFPVAFSVRSSTSSARPPRLCSAESSLKCEKKGSCSRPESAKTSSKKNFNVYISRSTSSTSCAPSRTVTVVAGFVGPRRSSSSSSSAPRRDNSSVTRASADKLSGIVFEPFNEVRSSSLLSSPQSFKTSIPSRGLKFPNFKCILQQYLLEHARLTHRVSFSLPLSLAPLQVKPELANVSKLAEAADVSLARTGFTSDCEAALNEQIK